MTDDEAFIRAIVGRPGDDLPRLAYADWLDEHADPRGAYLRAERAAVAAGDAAGLRERAAGLDPVWVARVSRPPVGVCRTDITWVAGEGGDPVIDADFDRVERGFNITLPADYCAFLLNWNGGRFIQSASAANDVNPEHLFYPLDAAYEYPWHNLEHAIEQHREWVNDFCAEADDRIRHTLRNYIPVGAHVDDRILLGVREPESGRVVEHSTCYHFAVEQDFPLRAEATSFAEYLARPWPPTRPIPPPIPDDGFRF